MSNVWHTLLETAARTPSPHNVQPWRVKITSELEAELFIDARRTLPKEDVTGSFIILTMGMFIEALRIVAANYGFKLSYELRRQPEWYADAIINSTSEELLPFAGLQLTSANDYDEPSRYSNELFLARRTSRLSLTNEAVPETAARALAELAAESGQRYEQITNAGMIAALLECNTRALFEDLNMPAYHDEIAEWFRFTDRAARRTRDGLDYRCMNTSRTSLWLTARFPKLLQMRLSRPALWKIYRAQLGLVPTVGILAGAFWNPADAFDAGRFLMRFWLETARHGLYIHPYGNLVTNKAAAAWCLETTNIRDIWLVFKIGCSTEPPQSYRRTIEEILIA